MKLLIDVRLPSEYTKGHLNGYINMPYNNILTTIKNYPKNTDITLYCSHGQLSTKVYYLLKSMGYTNVKIYQNKD